MASDSSSPKRYAPNIKLPPYSFIPGKNPHPFRDQEGHSFGNEHEPEHLRSLDSGDYKNHPGFLYGIDLFNAGYFWECHELFEGIWKNTEDENTRLLLQGIIQCAAILLNSSLGEERENAVENLKISVQEKFSKIPNPFLGVDNQKLLSNVKEFLIQKSDADLSPKIILD
jgi:hypothetical protein